jgi:hypothetical protein
MNKFALRRYGPRVFISYSFRDADLAEQIERVLSEFGFQVRREDEHSLAGQRLSLAIPERIAEAEVLIQLLTATSNTSEWVAREFAYATERRDKKHNLVVLPIVFEKKALPSAVRDWWFLDLAGTQLTEQALERIKQICLRSVYLLPLADGAPWLFCEAEARALFSGLLEDDRRVIIDSDGCLLHWAQETIDHYSKVDGAYRDQFLDQERKRMVRLTRRLRVQDEVVRWLAMEIMREMLGYSGPDEQLEHALVPLQRYAAIVIGDEVIEAADVAPPAPHPLRTDRIAAVRDANTNGHSRGFLNPGFYAWAFDEKDRETGMAAMELRAPGFRHVRLLMPRHVFGSMADAYTRHLISFDPRAELLAGIFIKYVLPQVAVDASYNLTDPSTARTDLQTQYAWRLEQYDLMGMA